MNFRPLIDKTACIPKRFNPRQRISRVLGFALLSSALTGCHAPSQATEPHPPDHTSAQSDAHKIKQTLRTIFDIPGAPLTVKPVSIEGDFAVAGWIQHGTGGRTLLKRQQGQWKIAFCGDSGLIDPANLQKMGLSHSAAARLAETIKTAELGLTEQERVQISKFHGVMQISDGAGHPSPR